MIPQVEGEYDGEVSGPDPVSSSAGASDTSLWIDIDMQRETIEYASFVSLQKSFLDMAAAVTAIAFCLYSLSKSFGNYSSPEDMAVAILTAVIALSFALLSLEEFQISIRGRRFTKNFVSRNT